ncbi:MAG: ADP-forming succinate--CoA ligase subunit beta [Puniceicoccales bacterium]|jgi:succinyl-CoA synthetase beta subunit|nr:ADP-forming succinate--CoA ligase subunit beta [Puniceicoccales bacterium]
MNIHEYQAQDLLKEFNVPVPFGVLVSSGDDYQATLGVLHLDKICVKAQIHAGGRGAGHFKNDLGHGGVKIASSKGEALDVIKSMIGNTLITKQTGNGGKVVRKVYLVEPVRFLREYYVAILIDRNLRRPILMFSTEGGIDIETIANRSPEKLHKIIIEPSTGLTISQTKELTSKIRLTTEQARELSDLLLQLYALFITKDCSLIEINPLILGKSGHFLAIDSKINFDDNALPRHPDIMKLRDIEEENPNEVEALQHNLNYIALDGNIACLVNGAGLAMATMDLIQYHGGQPANFLDIGGGANEEQITHAFRIVLKNPNIRGIVVNIFGGIVKCNAVAQGIVNAAQTTSLSLPMVVRFEGTNVGEGKEVLKSSGLRITFANGLDDAANKIVDLCKQ